MENTEKNLLFLLKNWRLELDYFLRSRVSFRIPLKNLGKEEALYQNLHSEFLEFLELGKTYIPTVSKKTIEVLDIGARNFCFGPPIEEFLLNQKYEPTVRGIEIDAYRRMRNFRSRADYAEYFRSKMRSATFHAEDFLQWKQPADVIFLLNPFVEPEPLFSWGLPHRHFQPERIYKKCRELLSPETGWMVTCHPDPSEYQTAQTFTAQNGFKCLGTWEWYPRTGSSQTHPRLGAVWR